jgi:hypothetical protein
VAAAAVTMPKLMNNAVILTTMSLALRQQRRSYQRAGADSLVPCRNVLVVEEEVEGIDIGGASHQPYPHLQQNHTRHACARQRKHRACSCTMTTNCTQTFMKRSKSCK